MEALDLAAYKTPISGRGPFISDERIILVGQEGAPLRGVSFT